MNPKTEEFLNFLLWSADNLSRPTFRNLTESYESWAYRRHLLYRQCAVLEKEQLLEASADAADDRLYRLTEAGRLHALGGRDPQAMWSRPWDGLWRLVIFDLPTTQNSQRAKLRRYLRSKSFGYLQKSVWITPSPMDEQRQVLENGKINVESLIFLEARPTTGETDEQIVAGAWDFETINHRYTCFMKILESLPTVALNSESAIKAFRQWAAEERQAWLHAMEIDPLLPERLLPYDYLGRSAWRQRIHTQLQAHKLLKTFKIGCLQ